MEKNRAREIPDGIKRTRIFILAREIFPSTAEDIIKDSRHRSLCDDPQSLQKRRLACIVFSSNQGYTAQLWDFQMPEPAESPNREVRESQLGIGQAELSCSNRRCRPNVGR